MQLLVYADDIDGVVAPLKKLRDISFVVNRTELYKFAEVASIGALKQKLHFDKVQRPLLDSSTAHSGNFPDLGGQNLSSHSGIFYARSILKMSEKKILSCSGDRL